MRNLTITLLSVLCLSACDSKVGNTDTRQAEATEMMLAEANRQVGMPNIVNFTERKFAKMIRELCDTEVTTYTYIVNMQGEARFLCESIGYGIPYSVQFTNPEVARDVSRYTTHTYLALPQAEANGLFMPSSSSATWVIAATEQGMKVIYVESEILVSPFRLED